LMPLVTFALLWLVAKGSRWEKLYQASLLTLATSMLSGVLMTIAMMVVWPMAFSILTEQWLPSILMNSLPLIFNLFMTTLSVVLLRRQTKVKTALRFVATILVAVVATFFITDVAQTAYYVIMQYPDNQNLSSYTSSFVAYGVVMVVFAVTYALEKRRGTEDSFRRSAIISTVGLLALFTGMLLAGYLFSNDLEQWLTAGLSALLFIAAVVFYVWLYRTLRLMK